MGIIIVAKPKMPPSLTTLGAEIKRLRSLRGISQTTLALSCKVSQPFIARLERGERTFRIASPFATLISDALGVPLAHWRAFTPDGDAVGKYAEDFARNDPFELPLVGSLTEKSYGDNGLSGTSFLDDLEPIGPGQAVNVREKFPDACFALRVDGYSFEGKGIQNGDIIAVMPTDVGQEGRHMVVESAVGYTLVGCEGGKLWRWDYAENIKDGPDSYQVELQEGETIVGFVIQVLGDRRFRVGIRGSR